MNVALPMLRAAGCALLLLAACGGRTPGPVDDDDGAPGPAQASALFVDDDDQVCGTQADVEQAQELLADTQPGDALHVVEIAYADECTGLGGQHLIARTVDGALFFWLGGHGCQFVPAEIAEPGQLRFGVVRVSQTAALFQLPSDVCLAFPGFAGEISSDSKVRVLAIYASREDAEQAALNAG